MEPPLSVTGQRGEAVFVGEAWSQLSWPILEASCFALIFSLPAWVHPEFQPSFLGQIHFLTFRTLPVDGGGGETKST